MLRHLRYQRLLTGSWRSDTRGRDHPKQWLHLFHPDGVLADSFSMVSWKPLVIAGAADTC
jgi:hypothetical protein